MLDRRFPRPVAPPDERMEDIEQGIRCQLDMFTGQLIEVYAQDEWDAYDQLGSLAKAALGKCTFLWSPFALVRGLHLKGWPLLAEDAKIAKLIRDTDRNTR